MPTRVLGATYSLAIVLTGTVPALADACFSLPGFSAPSPTASYPAARPTAYPTERPTAPRARPVHHVAARHRFNAAASIAPAHVRPAAAVDDDDVTMPPPPRR